jgi:hypothetical protein
LFSFAGEVLAKAGKGKILEAAREGSFVNKTWEFGNGGKILVVPAKTDWK